MEEKLIWVLCDNKPGTAQQALSLAQNLSKNLKIIELKYNFLAKLPNFLLTPTFATLTKHSRQQIFKQNNLYHQSQNSHKSETPQIIISAGRRAAIIALAVKKIYPRVKIIQIMNPRINFNFFNCIILPNHDKISKKTQQKYSCKIIKSIGAITKINLEFIRQEAKKFSQEFKEINANQKNIALLIGGAVKGKKFSLAIAQKLILQAKKINQEIGGNLLILNSRRTSKEINQFINQNLNKNEFFFNYQQIENANNHNKNPYFAVINAAKFIIITGDSVSMICEAASSGKLIYIFDHPKISSKKHRKLHQYLFSQNYAKKLPENCSKLEEYQAKILQENYRIAQEIKNNPLFF